MLKYYENSRLLNLKKSPSKFTNKLLDFTLLELLILQQLYQIKQQITRYKLMQLIQTSIGESISASKFYRILTKLEKNKMVEYIPNEKSLYYITPRGLEALNSSKKVFGQFGTLITEFFSKSIDKIIEFSRFQPGRVLYIDFPKIFDLVILKLILENCEELNILSEDSTFKWLSSTLGSVKRTIFEDEMLKEPDNSFSLIILFYPSLYTNYSIFKEIFRCLKTDSHMLVIDSTDPLEMNNHFVSEILINQFWPIDYSQKKKILEMEKELNVLFKSKPLDRMNIKGLELYLYKKTA